MEILTDQTAIDYLGRAKKALHPEIDTFGSIPLLAKMIDVEQAWQKRLQAKGQTGVPLPISDYGLPELGAWRVDIKAAFQEVKVIASRRASVIDGFLQEFVDASEKGIARRGNSLTEAVSEDFGFLGIIKKFSPDQIEFLSSDWDESFPLYTDKNWPGLLLSRSDRSPFLDNRAPRRRFGERSFIPGYKFVDNTDREPFFLMVATSQNQPLGARVITSDQALTSRTEIRSKPIQPIDQPLTLTSHIPYYDFNRSLDLPFSSATQIEKQLDRLHPNLFQAVYDTDFTDKSPSSIDHFFKSLIKLNSLVDTIRTVAEQTLDNVEIDPDILSASIANTQAQIGSIYNSVLDNDLRRRLQIATAQELKAARDKAEVTKEQVNLVVQKPGILKRWWKGNN